MATSSKTRASRQSYVSPRQGVLPCFELPFSGQLSPDNRWVVLAGKLPWDILVTIYRKQMRNNHTGAGGINPRVVLGALIIKHICDLSDRETIQQIRENVYMQYFIGYSGFSSAAPFDSSLFVELRCRLGIEQINAINERIIQYVEAQNAVSQPASSVNTKANPERLQDAKQPDKMTGTAAPVAEAPTVISGSVSEAKEVSASPPEKDKNKSRKNQKTSTDSPPGRGRKIIDATVCPQDISYPTDLNLLHDARQKSEELTDLLYDPLLHGKKPRTYRRKARKLYLNEAQKKSSTSRAIRKANKKQLNFLKRNIGHIHRLLDKHQGIPLDRKQYKYLLVIQTVYDQQAAMYIQGLKRIDDRIVSIHQPHVRPMVRGKRNAKVEFGSKIQVSLMNGFSFLDDLAWDAFNEGTRLMASVEKYKTRFGYYPAEVLADKIYCTRENRKLLKGKEIKLRAKPLGRPGLTEAVENHVRPGGRHPIEGVFGQGKTAYGMNRIKARLSHTSGSWIATILLVINLVKITGLVCRALKLTECTFSAWVFEFLEYLQGAKPTKIRRCMVLSHPAAD
jgi:hypothetical protein